jgi:hypothetical protein
MMAAMDTTEAAPPPTAPECPCCHAPARDDDVECQGCRRRVCAKCIRFWGHHMLMCEECRAESTW